MADEVWDWRTKILNYAPENPIYRHVLLTLSCFMDSAGGSCFPSIKKLSECTSLSKPSVIKYINEAEKDGWIEKSIHGFSGQGWKRHEYRASVPEKVVKEINRLDEGGKPHRKGGKPDGVKVVKEVNTTSSYTSPYNSTSVYAFDEFWNDYDDKKDRSKCEKKFIKLSEDDRELILEFVPIYQAHEPEKQYRKNPLTFLNSEIWKDDWEAYPPKQQEPKPQIIDEGTF